MTSQAIKSSSLSCLVFMFTLNNTLSRSTSIWSSRNFAISNVSITAAPGSTWAHCIHPHPCSKDLPLLFVFTSETWICASDKLRICFLFLLLSPRRDFITYRRVLKIRLEVTNQWRESSVYSLSTTTLVLGPPPSAGKTSSDFVPEKWVCFLALFVHSSLLPHFPLEIASSSHKGFTLSAEAKKTLFPVQTLFLTQWNKLLVV